MIFVIDNTLSAGVHTLYPNQGALSPQDRHTFLRAFPTT
jgi:hypothetical protein